MPLQVATQPSETSFTENRRRAVRRPHVCEAWLRSPTDGEEEKTEVSGLDISRHGVAFESPRPVAEGCFYWVELGFGEQKIASEVRVTSCVESDTTPGHWRVGGEFC